MIMSNKNSNFKNDNMWNQMSCEQPNSQERHMHINFMGPSSHYVLMSANNMLTNSSNI